MTQEQIKFENMLVSHLSGWYYNSPYQSVGNILHWIYVFGTFDMMENCQVGNNIITYRGENIRIVWNPKLQMPIFKDIPEEYDYIEEKQTIFLSELKNKKYVVLEHLTLPDRGFRFWTMNTDENITCNIKGDVVYKPIMWTDEDNIATLWSSKYNNEVIATSSELEKYYNINNNKEIYE